MQGRHVDEEKYDEEIYAEGRKSEIIRRSLLEE